MKNKNIKIKSNLNKPATLSTLLLLFVMVLLSGVLGLLKLPSDTVFAANIAYDDSTQLTWTVKFDKSVSFTGMGTAQTLSSNGNIAHFHDGSISNDEFITACTKRDDGTFYVGIFLETSASIKLSAGVGFLHYDTNLFNMVAFQSVRSGAAGTEYFDTGGINVAPKVGSTEKGAYFDFCEKTAGTYKSIATGQPWLMFIITLSVVNDAGDDYKPEIFNPSFYDSIWFDFYDDGDNSHMNYANFIDTNSNNDELYYRKNTSPKTNIGNVPPEGESAELKTLDLKSGSTGYIKDFDGSSTCTAADISYAQKNGLTLDFTKDSPTAKVTVTVNGGTPKTDFASGTAIGGLNAGSNTVEVLVKDGAETATYTITATVLAASTDATLKNLSVSTGELKQKGNSSPSFSSAVLEYTLSLPYNTASVDITAEKNSPLATTKIHTDAANAKAINTYTLNLTIPTGGVPTVVDVPILVTPESVTPTQTYKITVTRELPSTDANLAEMKLTSPEAYDFRVGDDTAKLNYEKALAEGTGIDLTFAFTITKSLELQGVKTRYQKPISTGSWTNLSTAEIAQGGTIMSANSTLSLKKGEKVRIEITVTAQDTTKTKVYNFDVSRGVSSDTSLTSIAITESGTTKTYTDSTATPLKTNPPSYPLTATSTSITIVATSPSTENATISLYKGTGESATLVVEGATSAATLTYVLNGLLGFAQTTHVYTIRVTAAVGGSKSEDYILNIVKKSSLCELDVTVTHTDTGVAAANRDLASCISYNTTTKAYTVAIPSYKINGIVVDKLQVVLKGSINSTISPVNGFTAGTTTTDNEPTYYVNITINTVKGYDSGLIAITVKAEDSLTVANYSLRIIREAADTDNTLTDLKVNNNTVTGFASGTTSYSPDPFPRVTTEVSIVGSLSKPGIATLSYSTDLGSINASGQLTFASKGVKHTVTITVTAESGDQKKYTVIVIAANTDNEMKSIVLTDGKGVIQPLDVTFDKDVKTYNVSVASTVETIKITATANAGSFAMATAYISAGGTGSSSFLETVTYTETLSSTINTFTFKAYITSDSGVKGEEYTIIVTRQAARGDKYLLTLSVKNGGIELISSFTSAVLTYNVRVDRSVSSLTVAATIPTNGSTLSYANTHATTLGGTSTIIVTVTAEDKTYQEYKVVVTCKDDDHKINDITNDANASVTFTGATSYNLGALINSVAKINFGITLNNSNAVLWYQINSLTAVSVSAANLSSFDIAISGLPTGANTIKFYAKSEYGTSGQAYTYNFTRNAVETKNSLNTLTIKDGSGFDYMDGVFLRGTTSYSIQINRAVGTAPNYLLTVAATVQTGDISVIVDAPAPYTSYTFTHKPTQGGITTIYVKVKAENGTVNTYEIEVICKDNDNKINDITNDANASVTFTGATSYNLGALANSVTKINFGVELNNAYAVLWYQINSIAAVSVPAANLGSFDIAIGGLSTGANTIKFYAKSEYGTTGQVYTYNFTRNSVDADATLSSLSVKNGGTELIPVADFSPTTLNYSVRVDTSVSSVSVSATATKSTSKIDITPAATGFALPNNALTVFYIKVTPESGTANAQTYTVNVYRASNNNTISDIKIDGASVTLPATPTPGTPAVITITPKYPFSVKDIDITVLLADADALAYLNATAIPSGEIKITLVNGTQNLDIYAFSKYGMLSGTQTAKAQVPVYRLVVERTPASTNTELEALTVTDSSGVAIIGVSLSPSFSSGTYNYTITLDKNSAVREIKLNASVTAPKKVTGDGIKSFVELADGSISTSFTITVTAEDGTTTKDYSISLTKPTAKSSDASIDSVVLLDPSDITKTPLSPFTFVSANTNQGTFTIPYTMSGVDLAVAPTHNKATVAFIGAAISASGRITVGAGATVTVQFQVTAEDGTTKGTLYSISIKRESANTEKYLQTLVVYAKDGTTKLLDLTHSTGTPIPITINLRVNDIVANEEVTISATVPTGNFSTITTDLSSAFVLTSGGTKTITITVQPQGGTAQNYTINIQKANNVSDIVNITVDGETFTVDKFTLSGSDYVLELPDVIFSKKTVEISAVTTDTKATVTGKGTVNLDVKTNRLEVYATAQDGVTKSKIYIIVIKRLAASKDNDLKELIVLDNKGNELLNLSGVAAINASSLTITVERSVASVDVIALANHGGAVVSGQANDTGTNIALIPTYKELTIIVKAEDNTQKTYTVKITIKDDDNTISAVAVTSTPAVTLNPITFNKDDFGPYDLGTVPYNTISINFAVTLANQYAQLYVDGALAAGTFSSSRTYTVALKDNLNTIIVYALSERGTKGDEYIFTVTRTPAETNAKLSELRVEDDKNNILFGETDFSSETYVYTIDIPSGITVSGIEIFATAAIASSKVTGDVGTHTITETAGKIDRTFTITVTAQSGDTKTYTVKLTKGITLSSDASVKSVNLTDTASKSYMTFDPLKAAQDDIEIPYVVAGLYIEVLANNSAATVVFISGNSGFIPVTAGGSVNIEFKVVAQDGVTKSLNYTFKITRAAARTENYLDTLTVINSNGAVMLLDLDHSVKAIDTTIKLRVDDNVSSVIISVAVPSGNGSKLTTVLLPSYSLTSGATRSITITVEDEAGKKKDYTLEIQRANNTNALKSITVDGTEILIGEFKSSGGGNPTYTVPVTLVHSVKTTTISATLADLLCKATISGDGLKTLEDGPNTFTIQATAQDGTPGPVYQLIIVRATVSNNADLKNLTVKDVTNAPVTSVIKQADGTVAATYDINVTRLVKVVDISGIASHAGASVSGDTGEYTLTLGATNTYKIYVTAEDGTTKKTYTINITAKDDNNTINNITVATTPANAIGTLPTFAGATESYDLGTVVYNTESLTFTITLSNRYAKVYVVLNGGTPMLATGGNTSRNCIVTLADGQNTIEIYALSESGIEGTIYTTYTYEIERILANTDTELSDLRVKDTLSGDPLTFSTGIFESTTYGYTIVLPSSSTITGITISATAKGKGAKVTGTGAFTLTVVAGVISNTFTIKVTAESGATQEYTVLVVRNAATIPPSDDNDIASVSLMGKGTEYMVSFNALVSAQSPITVPYGVDEVFLVITPAHAKAKVLGITGGGRYSVAAGGKTTITFRVEAENGDSTVTYSIEVTRELADTNNVLLTLYYEENGTQYSLDVSQNIFNIDLSNSVSSVIVGGTKPPKATVSGFGTVTLSGTTTTKTVTVTAEDGTQNSYILYFIRKSDDATVKSIMIDGVERFGSFTGANREYTITIPYSQANVVILAAANDAKATVTGNGSHTMGVGANTVEIYATSEKGTKGDVYTLIVNRTAASNNSYLSALSVKDTAPGGSTLTLNPTFLNTTQNYTIDLTGFSSVSEIEIFATAESPFAIKIEGTGKFILKTLSGASSEIFTVTVTAEDGSTRKYNITVTRNVDPNDDITIDDMSLIGSDSVNYLGVAASALNQFSINTKTYNITVPFKVKNVTLYVNNLNGASITGNGRYDINATGTTTVTFYLDSKSGKITSDTYTIIISRQAPNTDSKLSELKIDGAMVDGFDPLITSYTITVSLETVDSIVVFAKANDVNATVLGDLGKVNLVAGTNLINITVTAEDLSTTTYTLIVKRLSFDNELKDLTVADHPLNTLFNPALSNYTLTVPYSEDRITILASANPLAKITGTGVKTLTVGSANVFEVYATSESGVKGKVYTITVTRTAASTDATLKSLAVYSGGTDPQRLELSPAFNRNTKEYVIQIPNGSGISSLTIDALANCPFNKGVGGAGYKVLKALVDGIYNNVFEIIVMAEDGSVTDPPYLISVLRDDVKLSDDITIAAFTLIGSDGINYLATNGGISRFLPNVYSYNISVPYSVDSLTLALTPLTTATTYGNGTKIFGASNTLTFETYLVSQSGKVESAHYIINVTREIANSDNTLKEIKINDVLIDGFDPNITQYSINIPFSSKNDITISVLLNDSTATILSGTGSFTLAEGNSVYSIIVRAQDGKTKSYNLMISYLNANAFLDTLTVSGSKESIYSDNGADNYVFEFNPEINEYTIRVSKETKSINIKGTAQDQLGSAIVGLGKYSLVEDIKTITISVISADKSTTISYVLNIVREDKSRDSKLKELTIGGLEGIGFDPDRMIYDDGLTVDSNTESLTINAIPNEPNATVTIIGDKDLKNGRNAILVSVRAENGSTSVYQVIVNKQGKSDDSKLLDLVIGGHEIAFNPNPEKEYTLYVDSKTDSLKIDAFTQSANATYKIDGDKDLKSGRNVVRITVTAEDGKTTSTYYVIVNKDPAQDNFLMILVIAVFALWMLTILILLYRHYRNSKKREKELDEYRYNDKKNKGDVRTR